MAEIQLSQHEGHGSFGSAVNLRVDLVNALFAGCVERGFGMTGRLDSSVRCAPVDQTWRIREFYAADADGNTLRFG